IPCVCAQALRTEAESAARRSRYSLNPSAERRGLSPSRTSGQSPRGVLLTRLRTLGHLRDLWKLNTLCGEFLKSLSDCAIGVIQVRIIAPCRGFGRTFGLDLAALRLFTFDHVCQEVSDLSEVCRFTRRRSMPCAELLDRAAERIAD